ncbi:MAG: protein kinase domain-containing protein [Thermoplasmatota archaeon]
MSPTPATPTPDPELAFPLDPVELRFLAPLEWRELATARGKDVLEYWNPVEARWYGVARWARGVFEGLDAREPHAAIVARVLAAEPELKVERVAEHITRSFLSVLAGLGYVEIVLPPPPHEIGGRFRIERELGRGGVSVAYFARDGATGDACVVKRPWGFHSPLPLASRWQREEAETLAHLDHPRIVPFLALVEEADRASLARGYVDGRDLFSARGPGKALSPDERRKVYTQAAETIVHAHARGILLVDIKPQNYVLTPSLDVVLTDVGNAVASAGLAETLVHRVGTKGFMAPETAKGKRVDERSEVWSFGRFVASVALGQHIRTAWGYEGVLRELDATPTATPFERALVADCTREDPRERPRDMRVVLERLETRV